MVYHFKRFLIAFWLHFFKIVTMAKPDKAFFTKIKILTLFTMVSESFDRIRFALIAIKPVMKIMAICNLFTFNYWVSPKNIVINWKPNFWSRFVFWIYFWIDCWKVHIAVLIWMISFVWKFLLFRPIRLLFPQLKFENVFKEFYYFIVTVHYFFTFTNLTFQV